MLPVALLVVAIPAVVLSDSHRAMCRVAVGDAFPAMAGLAEARGAKATVVVAPGGPRWMGEMLAADLKSDFAPAYTGRGVALVALGEGPLAEGVRSLPVDPSAVESALGAGRLPRVYALDASGKVVWFDLEYSLSTHRELHAVLDELTAD